jgi:lantibiotic modifying enzyme
MVECGEHLLRTSVEVGGGRAWPSRDGSLLAGFAHGAAGIAYALGALADATGDSRYRQAAIHAQVYEQSVYSEDERNWPVLEKALRGRPIFMTTWCHGAPGIALSRLALLQTARTDSTLADLVHAVETTVERGFGPIDHLCCGNFGRADVLLTVGIAMRRPDLVELARRGSAAVIAAADRHGSFRLLPGDVAHFEAGLFRGYSGIGYEMLRLAEPESVPSVLTFQTAVPRATSATSSKERP